MANIVSANDFAAKVWEAPVGGLAAGGAGGGATDVGGCVAAVGLGLPGMAGDPEALLNAIRTIAHDEGCSAAMRTAGRATLEGVFSARRAADQILRKVP